MSDEDWLDAVLQDEVAYLEDDGFTDQLMSRLPPAKKKVKFWFEPVVVLISTLTAMVFAMWVIPGFDRFVTDVIRQSLNNSLASNGAMILFLLLGLVGLACLIGDSDV